jgi:thymidylate kinase
VDVEPEAVVSRLKPRKSVMEDLETQHKVRRVYMNFVSNGKLVKIDGSKSKRKVADDILKLVLKSFDLSVKKD